MADNKSKNTLGGSVKKDVMGDNVSKGKTLNGPHLNQGEGTEYNKLAIGKSFLAHDPRAGHKQERNIEDYRDGLNTDD